MYMEFQDLIKREDYIQNLLKEKKEGKLSSSNLFICKDDAFNGILLQLVARLILCENDICGTCENCLKIISGTHPDVKIYPKNQTKLLVADSNEIVQESYVKPIYADNKIFVINNIDSSTEESQNKLLKILEEPPRNVYFLLGAKVIDNVLPTIRSRCNKIEIGSNNKEIINSIFPDRDLKTTLALSVSEGYLGKTKQYLEKKNFEEICNFAISIVTDLKSSKEVLPYSKKMYELRNDYALVMFVLGLALEDLLKIKCGREDLVKLEMFKEKFEKVKNEYSEKAIIEISKLIPKVDEKIKFNVQSQMIFDNFLLSLLEVKFICR